MPYAGFWRRLVAYAADLALLALVYAVMFAMPLEPRIEPYAFAGGFYALVVAWLYFAGMESSKEQATLGKMLVGIRVADLQGRRIGFLRATGRHFAKIVSAFTLYAGFIMAALTARRQGLHDKLAGTLVLRGRAQESLEPAAIAPSLAERSRRPHA